MNFIVKQPSLASFKISLLSNLGRTFLPKRDWKNLSTSSNSQSLNGLVKQGDHPPPPPPPILPRAVSNICYQNLLMSSHNIQRGEGRAQGCLPTSSIEPKTNPFAIPNRDNRIRDQSLTLFVISFHKPVPEPFLKSQVPLFSLTLSHWRLGFESQPSCSILKEC